MRWQCLPAKAQVWNRAKGLFTSSQVSGGIYSPYVGQKGQGGRIHWIKNSFPYLHPLPPSWFMLLLSSPLSLHMRWGFFLPFLKNLLLRLWLNISTELKAVQRGKVLLFFLLFFGLLPLLHIKWRSEDRIERSRSDFNLQPFAACRPISLPAFLPCSMWWSPYPLS